MAKKKGKRSKAGRKLPASVPVLWRAPADPTPRRVDPTFELHLRLDLTDSPHTLTAMEVITGIQVVTGSSGLFEAKLERLALYAADTAELPLARVQDANTSLRFQDVGTVAKPAVAGVSWPPWLQYHCTPGGTADLAVLTHTGSAKLDLWVTAWVVPDTKSCERSNWSCVRGLPPLPKVVPWEMISRASLGGAGGLAE